MPESSDRWQSMEYQPFPTLSVIGDRSELSGIGMTDPKGTQSWQHFALLIRHGRRPVRSRPSSSPRPRCSTRDRQANGELLSCLIVSKERSFQPRDFGIEDCRPRFLQQRRRPPGRGHLSRLLSVMQRGCARSVSQDCGGQSDRFRTMSRQECRG
jgi:hypothetical protein